MSFLDQQFNQKVDSYFISKELFESYHKILKDYWNQDYSKALTQLVDTIEDLESSEASSLFYRMWIEILAEQDDQASLMALLKHFMNLSHVDSISSETLIGLRGIIHLELDEIKLCKHLSKLAEKNFTNPYCIEFYQRYQARFAPDQKENIFLSMTKSPIVDYFHWQSLTKSLLSKGKLTLLDRCLDYVENSYESSPLKKEYNAYKNLDTFNLDKAESLAHELTKTHKNNTSYQFLYGYILSCNDKLKESNKVLSHLMKKHDQRDGDIYSLLGYNSYLMSYGDTNSSNWENAINYLLKAEKSLREEGLPTKEVNLNLSMIDHKQREVNGEGEVERDDYRYWLVNISSDTSADYFSNPENSEFLFCNLGSKPRAGDLVFFINKKTTNDQHSLFALYTVLDTPTWDHLDQYQTPLKQLYSLERPVELPKSLKEKTSPLLQTESKQSFKIPKGVYLLSEKGLNSLGKALVKDIDSKEIVQEIKTTLRLAS